MSTKTQKRTQFNYETKLFAESKAMLNPTNLSALKLKYCLEALTGIKGKILEIGCGGGGFIEGIRENLPKLSYFGVDISQKAIEIAQKNYPKIMFKKAPAEKLPYLANFFNAVIVVDTLEHIRNTKKVISEIKRVLKRGGIFYLCVPCEGNFYTIYYIFSIFGFYPKQKYAGHIHQFTTQSLSDIIKSRGYFVIERYWFLAHPFFQIFDFGYFSFLAFRGRGTKHTLEGYIKSESKGVPSIFIKIIKNIFSVVSYFESRLFWWLPASAVCIKAKKGKNV